MKSRVFKRLSSLAAHTSSDCIDHKLSIIVFNMRMRDYNMTSQLAGDFTARLLRGAFIMDDHLLVDCFHLCAIRQKPEDSQVLW